MFPIFFGFCSFHFATFFVTTNETWVLLHLFVLHVLFCSSVFFPCSYVFAAVRGVILKNKKAGGGLGGGRSASPPDALGVVAVVRVAFLVLFFSFYS